MAMIGMDVEAVNSFGGQLKNQGQAIQGVISSVDHLVSQLEGVWKGNDATTFQGWWVHTHRPALIAAMNAVDGLGQSAINNASEQSQASGR
jgi:uncharacterized protein YukE